MSLFSGNKDLKRECPLYSSIGRRIEIPTLPLKSTPLRNFCEVKLQQVPARWKGREIAQCNRKKPEPNQGAAVLISQHAL